MLDLNSFSQLAVIALPLAGFVTGLTEVFKRAFAISDRYIPLTAIVVGAGLGLLVIQLSTLGAVVGVALGLSSVGLWEVGKKVSGN